MIFTSLARIDAIHHIDIGTVPNKFHVMNTLHCNSPGLLDGCTLVVGNSKHASMKVVKLQ